LKKPILLLLTQCDSPVVDCKGYSLRAEHNPERQRSLVVWDIPGISLNHFNGGTWVQRARSVSVTMTFWLPHAASQLGT